MAAEHGKAEMQGLPARADLIHSESAVQQAVDVMAGEIERRMSMSDPVLIAVMTGGMIPTVWLSSRLTFPHQIDYVHATRYQSGTRGGQLEWRSRPHIDLRDRSVLVIDDILDKGITLSSVAEMCREAGARDVRTAVLVEKRCERSACGVTADFVGLQVPDRYVFGCGMDYQEYFRNLNAIYALPLEDTGP